MNRRGTTLVELLVAIALLGLLAIFTVSTVRGIGASARRAVDAAATRRGVTALHALLRHDLTEATPADLVIASPVMRYARPVGAAAACAISSTTATLALDRWRGTRVPAAGRDDAWLLTDIDGLWQRATVVAVATTSCPDGRAAWDITFDRSVVLPLVRVIEPVRLAMYRSGMTDWLGLAPAGGATPIQPFAGPIAVAGVSWALVGSDFVAQAAFASRRPSASLRIPLPVWP